MDEQKAERTTASRVLTSESELSPIDMALNHNDEVIMALEKQVEGLDNRLSRISNPVPADGSEKDSLGMPGNSSIVETIHSHGHRLGNLSDLISHLNRNLEI